MDKLNYLLTCLIEECAEIQQICTKAQRFGLDSYNPDDPLKRKNIDKLKLEINDLFGVIRILEYMELWNGDVKDTKMIIDKIHKIDKMMEISRNLGKVTEGL